MLKLIAASTFFAVNAAPLVIPGPEIASLPYLKAGKLQTLDSQKKQFQVRTPYRMVYCNKAKRISVLSVVSYLTHYYTMTL